MTSSDHTNDYLLNFFFLNLYLYNFCCNFLIFFLARLVVAVENHLDVKNVYFFG